MESSSFRPIDEGIPFDVECDAPEITLSATFMCITVQENEMHYPPV